MLHLKFWGWVRQVWGFFPVSKEYTHWMTGIRTTITSKYRKSCRRSSLKTKISKRKTCRYYSSFAAFNPEERLICIWLSYLLPHSSWIKAANMVGWTLRALKININNSLFLSSNKNSRRFDNQSKALTMLWRCARCRQLLTTSLRF